MSLNISLFSRGYKKAILVSFMLTCSATQAFATSTLMDPPKALAKIEAQNQYFGQAHVVQSGKNVYTAVGFHGATTSMIVGDDGVIMIDALYGPKSAGEAMKALRKASGCDLPVKAIIYTHSHDDHIGGASAYITNETHVRIELSPESETPFWGYFKWQRQFLTRLENRLWNCLKKDCAVKQSLRC